MVRTRFITSGLAAAVVLAGCAKNPATGANQLMLVSESQEIQMGQQYDKEVIASIGLYPDPALQTYIQELGTRLAATSERPKLPWTFRVVDDPAVNAFALPGGFIYVTRGLLAHMNSEAELATVVGHEIGHVTARHTAAQMSKEQLIGLGLAVGSIASPTFERYAGTASQALGLLFLKFSRDNENQADQLGLRYAGRANYDARKMANVMTLLDKISQQSGSRLPEWMATHPNPGNRLQHINTMIAQLPQDFAGTMVNRDSYERRLDGIIFGMNPREGFFKGPEFFHPDLKFRMSFPSGWSTFNGKDAVAAMSPQQDAVIELTMVKEGSADQAARAFLSTAGMQGGAVTRSRVNGMSASEAPFGATTQSGAVRGMAVFVEYGGGVYRLLGYSPESRWSTNQSVAQRALYSFGQLTDPAMLNVQPQHLDVLVLDRRTTLAELAQQRPPPVPVATLALINQVDEATPLEPGRLVKWVIGQPLP
ncbi:MAG TPA: M48 family metalloprotease [Gemmatimonadales bacterium]|nr:M48 family metalloprotease [Gemmatimonadales bacterium]